MSAKLHAFHKMHVRIVDFSVNNLVYAHKVGAFMALGCYINIPMQ